MYYLITYYSCFCEPPTGFVWDTSDWDPAPNFVRSDQNRHSAESNNAYFSDPKTGNDTEGEGYDSEYVGDSECAEMDDDDDENLAKADYIPGLNFEEILKMRESFQYGPDEEEEDEEGNYSHHDRSRNLHDYLPPLNISQASGLQGDDLGAGGGTLNGNYSSADFISRDDDDDVIHYGFPLHPGGPIMRIPGPRSYPSEAERGMNLLDDMSVSACGGHGGRESMSDISGLCEIEDSDVGEDAGTGLLASQRTRTDV